MKSIVVLACSVAISSCSALGISKNNTCTSEDSKKVISDIIIEAVEKNASENLSTDDGGVIASKANLRASLSQFIMSIEDVRTAKEDPQSTKRFCTGSFKVTIPDSILKDANRSFEIIGDQDITSRADRSGIDSAANKFSVEMDFDIQPTDDNKKIYGEVTDSEAIITFLSDIVVAHLAKSRLEDNHAMLARDQAEQTRLQNEALTQQRAAALEEAKTMSTLATQQMTATWAGIPKDTQTRLTANQTAWNAKKRADCTIEAAGVSTDPEEREASRLVCDARMTQSRTNELARFVSVVEPAQEQY